MNPVVILCRHGNTFEKGDKVVMVGAREDVPLTSRGLEQAKEVGAALANVGVSPSRIISGPLKRTKDFADRVRVETSSSALVEIDQRLIEFDYGAWSGLSNEEIISLSGKEVLDAWQERSIRPAGISFLPDEARARAEARDLLKDLSTGIGCSVVVTSNGRLRELGQVLSASTESFKVGTGHSCVLLWDGNGWQNRGWNLLPEQLAQTMKGLR